MALELEGRIARKLNVQTGTSARGTWSKQEFIFEYQEGNFPTQICMNVWGDEKVRDLEKYQVGDKVKVSLNLSSREYNGRWYTDVRVWRIEPAGVPSQETAPQETAQYQAPQYAAPVQAPVQSTPLPTIDDLSSPVEDDLPF